jgi:hypothetical protein
MKFYEAIALLCLPIVLAVIALIVIWHSVRWVLGILPL